MNGLSMISAAGIYEDFHELAKNAGLTAFLHDQRDQYFLLTNIFVKNFHSILGAHHLRWSFIYMISIRRCQFMIFVGFVWSLSRAR